MSGDVGLFRSRITKHLERGAEKPVPEYTRCVTNRLGYSYFTTDGKVDYMNYSTAIFLINDDVRALLVVFSTDEERQQKVPRYMVKTFDKTIAEGDYVVVPSTMGMENLAIARVTDVDVEVDFDSTTHVPWVVQRISLDEFNETTQQEDVAVAAIRQAHFVAKKKQLGKDLFSARTLAELPLVSKKPREIDDFGSADG
jgi:hypothetical protein